MFSSQGWVETRMEDIAASAGVSPATAYNHFPSKHSLVAETYAPLLRPLLMQAELDATVGRPVVAALKDQVTALSRISFRYRRLTAAFWSAAQEYSIRTVGRADPDGDLDPRIRARVAEPIRLLIEYGQRTGDLRRYPPAVEASQIVVELLLTRSVGHPDESSESTSEMVLTVLFGMLCPEMVVRSGRHGRSFGPPGGRPP
jgi:AcrR family transcriptional regulator